MKTPNKRELRQIAIHQILTLKVLWKFIKKCTAENCSFLVNDMKLPSDNPLHLQKKKFKMNI